MRRQPRRLGLSPHRATHCSARRVSRLRAENRDPSHKSSTRPCFARFCAFISTTRSRQRRSVHERQTASAISRHCDLPLYRCNCNEVLVVSRRFPELLDTSTLLVCHVTLWRCLSSSKGVAKLITRIRDANCNVEG